jgi:GNAT superfamily N-acetyltransferase
LKTLPLGTCLDEIQIPMNVRRFRVGDEEELWRLYHDTTRKIVGRDYTQEQVERWAPDQKPSEWDENFGKKIPFIAEEDGKIVGFAELEPTGHVDHFYCHYQWQRKGVGKLLLQALEGEAIRLEINWLFTEVSLTAREFFLSRGFEIVRLEENLICGAIAKRFQMRKALK